MLAIIIIIARKGMYMQITKNQHYVPRFYMKYFSNIRNAGTKKEKVLISFYQFKDNILRENIPTTSVCSEDYFYGQDGKTENSLAEMAILKVSGNLLYIKLVELRQCCLTIGKW